MVWIAKYDYISPYLTSSVGHLIWIPNLVVCEEEFARFAPSLATLALSFWLFIEITKALLVWCDYWSSRQKKNTHYLNCWDIMRANATCCNGLWELFFPYTVGFDFQWQPDWIWEESTCANSMQNQNVKAALHLSINRCLQTDNHAGLWFPFVYTSLQLVVWKVLGSLQCTFPIPHVSLTKTYPQEFF